eukprot:g10095.t1
MALARAPVLAPTRGCCSAAALPSGGSRRCPAPWGAACRQALVAWKLSVALLACARQRRQTRLRAEEEGVGEWAVRVGEWPEAMQSTRLGEEEDLLGRRLRIWFVSEEDSASRERTLGAEVGGKREAIGTIGSLRKELADYEYGTISAVHDEDEVTIQWDGQGEERLRLGDVSFEWLGDDLAADLAANLRESRQEFSCERRPAGIVAMGFVKSGIRGIGIGGVGKQRLEPRGFKPRDPSASAPPNRRSRWKEPRRPVLRWLRCQ